MKKTEEHFMIADIDLVWALLPSTLTGVLVLVLLGILGIALELWHVFIFGGGKPVKLVLYYSYT